MFYNSGGNPGMTRQSLPDWRAIFYWIDGPILTGFANTIGEV